jgi:hypothetical protein
LFEEHKSLIKSVIWKNHPLLAALHLDFEDVSQQLSITMLLAIRKFDPNRSESLAAHIRCSLQYEILNIKRRHKPHGVVGIPKDFRPEFRYLAGELPDGSAYELPVDDDMTAVEVSDLFGGLSEQEAEAVTLRLHGHPVRRKAHKAALEGVQRRFTPLYHGQEIPKNRQAKGVAA